MVGFTNSWNLRGRLESIQITLGNSSIKLIWACETLALNFMFSKWVRTWKSKRFWPNFAYFTLSFCSFFHLHHHWNSCLGKFLPPLVIRIEITNGVFIALFSSEGLWSSFQLLHANSLTVHFSWLSSHSTLNYIQENVHYRQLIVLSVLLFHIPWWKTVHSSSVLGILGLPEFFCQMNRNNCAKTLSQREISSACLRLFYVLRLTKETLPSCENRWLWKPP